MCTKQHFITSVCVAPVSTVNCRGFSVLVMSSNIHFPPFVQCVKLLGRDDPRSGQESSCLCSIRYPRIVLQLPPGVYHFHNELLYWQL